MKGCMMGGAMERGCDYAKKVLNNGLPELVLAFLSKVIEVPQKKFVAE